MIKRSKGEKIFAVFNTILLTGLCVIFILPVWHVAMASISDPGKISAHSGLVFWPVGKATLGGYQLVMQNSAILRSYLNSLIYVVGATAFALVLTILAAYVLSRKDLYWQGLMAGIVAFTMIFSGGLIPGYMLVKNLHMLDTRLALIIPFVVSAYNIIIMRTSFAQIPEELFEAARIDGAGYVKILLTVVLPVSKAIIAVIVLFYAIHFWNSWFSASIYLTDRTLFPLQLTLREVVLLASENAVVVETDGEDIMLFRPLIKYATIMVSTIPMLIIYPFAQKYFVTGVMIGAIKG
ncbi:MAG: carbohydrate ABC transporter permease [Lachnospiraceae bacterium]|nr:carbohydrate ABC transporter permease [Lachnospiraceae bacterium]